MSASPPSSPYVLTITGDQLQEQVALSPDRLLFDVIARGNDPVSSISFELKDEDVVGWIDLDPESNAAHVQRLEVEQPFSSWTIHCAAVADCRGHGTYRMQAEASSQQLSLQFHGAPIQYQSGTSRSQQAEVSGQLLFQIPAHWAALQPDRFPALPVQGAFVLDGKPYTLVRANTGVPESVDDRRIAYRLTFRHQDEWIDFSFRQDSALERPSIQMTTDDRLYELQPSAPGDIWAEDDRRIAISAKGLALQSHDGQVRYLDVDLVIPKNRARLTIDEQKAVLAQVNSDLLAEARNGQRIYQLFFLHRDALVALELIEEEAGYFSLRYINAGGEQYRCGDDRSACEGLVVGQGRQSFRLNRVRLGQSIFNGEVFVAGVL